MPLRLRPTVWYLSSILDSDSSVSIPSLLANLESPTSLHLNLYEFLGSWLELVLVTLPIKRFDGGYSAPGFVNIWPAMCFCKNGNVCERLGSLSRDK